MLAQSYLAMDTKLDEAIDLARKATELKPEEALFFATLSQVHERRGARKEAIEAIEKALELRPYHEVFKNRCAELQRREG
jgi:Flp pilus assembly protein TadD